MEIHHPDGRVITTSCDGRCYCHGLPISFGTTNGCCNNCSCPKSSEAFERAWKKAQGVHLPEKTSAVVFVALPDEVHPLEMSDVSTKEGVKFIHCGACGKCVSTGFYPVPTDTPDKGLIIRAWVLCPECIPAETKKLFLDGEPRERCGGCDGSGIVGDPHHGHAMRCERCSGTGEAK